ncbi:MAG TPA: hypothetical protein VMD79_07495 [Solirubrobacteraceae bacterium]|nr:hypothetical protein [Solirubrobacteraceae bacterium]
MQGRLDVGAVIGRVFEIYVEQAPVLMPTAAVVFVFTGIIASLLVSASSSLTLLALLIDLVATTVYTGMIVELVADVRDGRRDSSVGQLLRAVSPVLGQLIVVGLVAGVALVIGFALFLVPGLVLLTLWAVFAPVVVLEHPPGLRALSRSRELVQGNAWRVFLVIFALIIIVVVISGVIEVLAASAGTGVALVVRVVIGVLTAPLSALAAAVLYFDLLALSAGGAGSGGGGFGAGGDQGGFGADGPGSGSGAGGPGSEPPSDAERAFGA